MHDPSSWVTLATGSLQKAPSDSLLPDLALLLYTWCTLAERWLPVGPVQGAVHPRHPIPPHLQGDAFPVGDEGDNWLDGDHYLSRPVPVVQSRWRIQLPLSVLGLKRRPQIAQRVRTETLVWKVLLRILLRLLSYLGDPRPSTAFFRHQSNHGE